MFLQAFQIHFVTLFDDLLDPNLDLLKTHR